MSDLRHVSVLHTAVLEILGPKPGEDVLDVTLGLAGHAESFLRATAPDGRLAALDADGENLAFAKERLAPFAGRTEFHHCNFRDVASLQLAPVDILFADLGLSSPHVDNPERGFSFRFDGPFDLRFDRSRGETAADFLERITPEELYVIFRKYGELQQSSRLSKLLAGKRWDTTTAVKEKVEEAYGYRAKSVLPQVFQSIRIALNDEMHALEELLRVGPQLLKEGGRMGVISFHSLEDRLVKHTFRELCAPEKDIVTGKIAVEAPFELVTPKAVVPSDEEISHNPRARSAKFRVIRKKS